VNGVPLSSLPLAVSFDGCMGHTQKDVHRYHYHLAPICLLYKLGVPVPTKAHLLSSGTSAWQQVASGASPIVGWALDGYPIKGPYADDGKLLLQSSDLDECGGTVGLDGGYSYHITPDSPYILACFRGPVVGTHQQEQIIPQKACPSNGVSLTFHFTNQEWPPCTALTYQGPYFLFPVGLTHQAWVIHAHVFAGLFLVSSIFVCWVSCTMYRQRLLVVSFYNNKFVTLALVFVMTTARGCHFALEPYYMEQVWHPILVGVTYGIVDPIVLEILALEISSLHLLVSSLKTTREDKILLRRFRVVNIAMGVFQFVTQASADVMRATGHNFPWLVVCRVYFIAWGFLVCTACVFYSVRIHRTFSGNVGADRVSSSGSDGSRSRRWVSILMIKHSAFTLCVFCLISLTACGLIWSDMVELWEYFTFMTVSRSMEVVFSFVVVVGEFPPKWFEWSSTSSRKRSLEFDGFGFTRQFRTSFFEEHFVWKWLKHWRPPTAEAKESMLQVKALRSRLRSNIIETGRLPMVVVPFADFIAAGEIPRSSRGLARQAAENEIVVFVSHRWWGGSLPDDEERHKHAIIVRGILALTRKLGIDSNLIAVWVDYACIDQDDPHLQMLGVQSLVHWAMLSDFLLIPSFPRKEDSHAFRHAVLPTQLLNYGERAWCRLEAYIFLCVSEAEGKPLRCFGFGNATGGEISSTEAKTGQYTTCFGMFSKSCESLRRLAGSKGSEWYLHDLPSSGELSCEDDRRVVLGVEKMVSSLYSECILRIIGVTHTSNEKLVIASKQLRDEAAESVFQVFPPDKIPSALSLFGNFIQGNGARALLEGIRLTHQRVQHLDLSLNPLGDDGAIVIARNLAACSPLRVLDLSGTLMGDVGAQAVAAVLGDDSYELELGPPTRSLCALRVLCVDHNNIGCDAAEEFARCFSPHIHLCELSLNWNIVGDRGAEALALGLQNVVSLEKLSLVGNRIGSRGGNAFCSSCIKHSVPTQVKLQDNPDIPKLLLQEMILQSPVISEADPWRKTFQNLNREVLLVPQQTRLSAIHRLSSTTTENNSLEDGDVPEDCRMRWSEMASERSAPTPQSASEDSSVWCEVELDG